MNVEARRIRKFVRKNNLTIYGAQSIKKQIGPLARGTNDYDILAKRPRFHAHKLEKELDKHYGDYYYTKPADHPGTWKIKHKGADGKRDTYDDFEIADFTKPNRRHKTKTIEGVRYVALSEVVKDKKKSARDPKYAFRKAKDLDDVHRIKLARKMKVRFK